MVYKELLESICAPEERGLQNICEGKLAKEMLEKCNELKEDKYFNEDSSDEDSDADPSKYEITILNKDDHSKIKVKLVDYFLTLGAGI